MEKGYLMDTNTAIDYFGNLLPINAVVLIQSIAWQISIVTKIEMLVWPKLTEKEINELLVLIDHCKIYNLPEEIVLQTIEVRRNYRIKLPDAIIAATALVNNLALVSRNTADFARIDGLQVINPYLL